MLAERIFNVGHINCAGCERTIRALLGEVDAIEHVSADYRTNTVAVRYDTQRVSRDTVVDHLTNLGYAPR